MTEAVRHLPALIVVYLGTRVHVFQNVGSNVRMIEIEHLEAATRNLLR